MQIKGNNPIQQQDVNFNYTHKENILTLLKALRIGNEITDKIQNELPVLNKFIIPGGDKLVSFCHVSRAVCRRAERKITKLSEFTEVNENILTYVNRLSDFLFVLARYYTMILDIEESYW